MLVYVYVLMVQFLLVIGANICKGLFRTHIWVHNIWIYTAATLVDSHYKGKKLLGILQLLLEIVTRHGLCATLSSIVFVKSGWDNFAGRRSRLSGLFCNSDRDRIERRWVSANLSPQFHKWPNFCEDFFFFSLPSNLKQTLGRQTTPPDFLLILASNHLWEWNTNRPTNSHRSDPSDGTGNGKIRLINI